MSSILLALDFSELKSRFLFILLFMINNTMRVIFLICGLLLAFMTELADELSQVPKLSNIPWHVDKKSIHPRINLEIIGISFYKKGELIFNEKKSTPFIGVYEFLVKGDKSDYMEETKASTKINLTSDLKQVVIITKYKWVVVDVPKIEALGSQVDLIKEFGILETD